MLPANTSSLQFVTLQRSTHCSLKNPGSSHPKQGTGSLSVLQSQRKTRDSEVTPGDLPTPGEARIKDILELGCLPTPPLAPQTSSCFALHRPLAQAARSCCPEHLQYQGKDKLFTALLSLNKKRVSILKKEFYIQHNRNRLPRFTFPHTSVTK